MPDITDYRFGRMTINHTVFTKDLVILPSGQVMDNWMRKSGHFLEHDDLKTLMRKPPKYIIIGTGASGRLRVDPDLLSLFERLLVDVDIYPTAEAVKRYQKKIRTETDMGACFHLTC